MSITAASSSSIQAEFDFARNDPFDHNATILPVLPALISGSEFMTSIRSFNVPTDAIAVWYFGQNGFVLKDESGLLTGNRPLPHQ